MPSKIFSKNIVILAAVAVLLLIALVAYQVPRVQAAIDWRMQRADAYWRGLVDPVKPMPTAAVTEPDPSATSTALPTLTATPQATLAQIATITPTATLQPTATPLPGSITLDPPPYEKQDMNNCGPATLTMYLRYYGWTGDQFKINDVIKPIRDDRNVNVEELMSFILTKVTSLEPQYRVGGDTAILRQLLANGFPVMIEEGMTLDESYWPNDDLWAGHYLLLTGYDDATQSFITQDSFRGQNRMVKYTDLDHTWKQFNHVYFMIYPIDQRDAIKSILGDQWDPQQNRKHALELAQSEIKADSTDSYALFNLGSNLVYFEKYQEAAKAYDAARKAGLPQRMLRYQFGPFFAYFHVARNQDLVDLTDYALKRTPNSEEAMLWRGWAFYHLGQKDEALKWEQQALLAHPGYSDAQYALDFIQKN